MKAREIAESLHAVPITLWDEETSNIEYTAAFATDLMSDALALIQEKPETVVLITGLVNMQTLRTAEMLDMRFIVFVRGKYPSDETIAMAEDMGITVIATDLTMYDACGLLFQKGLGGIYGSHSA